MMVHPKHIKFLLPVFGILLLAGSVFFFFSNPAESPSESRPPANFKPYETTLTGTYLCLPHTDTSGPQTLECALGLQADDGRYYALDFNQFSAIPPNIPAGSKVTATGTVTPIENLSSDHWRKYPIEGILSVTTFEAI